MHSVFSEASPYNITKKSWEIGLYLNHLAEFLIYKFAYIMKIFDMIQIFIYITF